MARHHSVATFLTATTPANPAPVLFARPTPQPSKSQLPLNLRQDLWISEALEAHSPNPYPVIRASFAPRPPNSQE